MSPQTTATQESPNLDELAKKLGIHLPSSDPAAATFGAKPNEETAEVGPTQISPEDEDDEEEEDEKRDPEKNRVRTSFSNNGFAKAAVVTGGSLTVIAAVVFFYTGVAGRFSDKPPEIQAAEQQQEEDPEDQRFADLQQSESQARAELALQRQQEQLAEVNAQEAEAEKNPNPQASPSAPSAQTPGAKPATTTTTSAQSSPPPRPARQSRVVDRSPPRPSVAARPPRPAIARTSPAQAAQVAQVDPQQEWQRLSVLGRYGAAPPVIVAMAPRPNPTRTPTANQTAVTPTTTGSAPAIERSNAPPLSQYVQGRVTSTSASTQSPQAQVLPSQRTLTTRRTVLVGSTASAEVVGTIVWSAQPLRSSPRFLIRLKEPLSDRDGQPILPADALLVVTPRPLADETGLADLEVVAVIAGEAEYTPPAGAIVIRGEGGDALIARGERRGSTFGADAAMVFSSMLAEVGSLTNRPTTTSSTSSISAVGSTTTSSSTTPPPDYVGAALEGGFGTLTEILSERNEAAIEEIMSAPEIFQIPSGTNVQVFVNRTMTF
jgi:hypothetical protein